jgi:hypothetical protein
MLLLLMESFPRKPNSQYEYDQVGEQQEESQINPVQAKVYHGSRINCQSTVECHQNPELFEGGKEKWGECS